MARALSRGIGVMQRAAVRNLAKDGPQKRRLPGAVRPDQRRELTAVHMQIHMGKNLHTSERNRKILDFRAAEMATVIG